MDKVIGINYTDKEITFEVGQPVRWLQRGLNRWLCGTIKSFKPNGPNVNETTVTVLLDTGKEVKTRLYQMF